MRKTVREPAARVLGAITMLALAGASMVLARASDITDSTKHFEATVLLPVIAVLIPIMAAYLVRGRSAGAPLVLTARKWKYRLLAGTALGGCFLTWMLYRTQPQDLPIAAYLPAVLSNLIFNIFEPGRTNLSP